MAVAAEHPTERVRVHETPYELRVEIELPEVEPKLLFSLGERCLQIRVFRPLEPTLPWHSNPNATPT